MSNEVGARESAWKAKDYVSFYIHEALLTRPILTLPSRPRTPLPIMVAVSNTSVRLWHYH